MRGRSHWNLLVGISCLWLFLAAPQVSRSQSFTNSATLAASTDGTNLIINYSLAAAQGWVTLFSASTPQMLLTNAKPVCLAAATPSLTGRFTVPIHSNAPVQFYRLLLEQWPTRGQVLVFTNGPIDFAAMLATYGSITNSSQPFFEGNDGDIEPTNSIPMIYTQPVAVWIDNLGTYNTNGALVGPNEGLLIGKYAQTSLDTFSDCDSDACPVAPLYSASNDFRVLYMGDSNVTAREGVLWSSQAQLYCDINRYREQFLNDAFIDKLQLTPQIAANLKYLQYRPDLINPFDLDPDIYAEPTMEMYEFSLPDGIQLFPAENIESVIVRTRGPFNNDASLPPISVAYDSGATVGNYATLAANWILGTNTGTPSDAFYGSAEPGANWENDVLSPFVNGLSAWVAYRLTGTNEVYTQLSYMLRIWNGSACGGTWIPCDRGQNISNVMMFNAAETDAEGVFPFTVAENVTSYDGPVASDLAALYFGAIFYDIANESGLGLYKTDLLIWKTLSLVTNDPNSLSMVQFGAYVQQAARLLWPDLREAYSGMSLYENDLVDVLASRGIPMNGVSDFQSNLPPYIGSYPDTLEYDGPGFGSKHPDIQAQVNAYGVYQVNYNTFTYSNPASYVAYQIYKHSKYGPCDEVAITDGTFTINQNPPFNWSYNYDGTFYTELSNRFGNLILFLPGTEVNFLRSRQRCPDEATGSYAEDVQPFGFIVTQAIPNGFSFTVSALSSNSVFKTYQLTIVDPSTNTLGAASYAWAFTDYMGNIATVSGSSVEYDANIDEPFTLSITRTRGSQSDTITMRERGNDLDRAGGNAFVRNLVP